MKEVISARIVATDSGEMEFMTSPENPSGNQLDVLIQLLGKQRQEAQPPVPNEMPFAMDDVPVARLSKWFVADSFQHGDVLGLRHPALGWIAIALPKSFPAELAKNLEELERRRQTQHPANPQ